MNKPAFLVFGLIVCVIIFAVGYVIGFKSRNRKIDGQMIIDYTNPERDVIQLNLEADPDKKDIYILAVRKRNSF